MYMYVYILYKVVITNPVGHKALTLKRLGGQWDPLMTFLKLCSLERVSSTDHRTI